MLFKIFAKKILILMLFAGALLGSAKYLVPKVDGLFSESAGKVESSSTSRTANEDKRSVIEIEPIPFTSETKTTDALRAGTSTLTQKGEPGEKTVNYLIVYEGGKEVSRQKVSEQVTKQPVKEITVKGTLVVD